MSHDLLDDTEQFIRTYVSFPSEHELVAVTLWTAHAHSVGCFDSSPRLGLLSPEPGSGKTRVLEVIESLTPDPMHVLSASPAAVFRMIDQSQPTLLFDEVDAIFGRYGKDDGAEDLRGMLNAGHRFGATIPRCVGPTHEVRQFPVYAAVALAGLGDLPDTLMSRSVIIRMRRRAPGEQVRPWRMRIDPPIGHALRDRLVNWTVSVADELADAWPDMPDGVTDRPADVWEPLLAIADAAGGDWPKRAREACVELTRTGVSREASLGVRLLTDLRDIFGDEDRVATTTLLERLHAIDEAPWDDLRGRPLDARGLARRLGQYGIDSTKVKIAGESLRGYRREDLWDAWQRYCPSPPGEAEPAEPPEPTSAQATNPVPANSPVPEPQDMVPEPEPEAEPESPPSTRDVPRVPEVPDMRGQTGLTPCAFCGLTTHDTDQGRCRNPGCSTQ